ncbi:hypothetical protein [uncultured Sphaerotilus sp.]|uniref:hypothetical protein n=1 Tax=uncultured Sphaerotilus sp. TaxID=474984 RepID=UPI0030CA54DE
MTTSGIWADMRAVATAILVLLLATALAGCGGGDQAEDGGAFEPALAPSQPANPWNRKTGV